MGNPKQTRIGDKIETTVRYPAPAKLILRLMTQAACAKADKFLANPKSGWELSRHKV